jgi:XTP/dITP diphosphohydrolase
MILERAVVASKNADKIAEIEAVLAEHGLIGEIVRDLDWEDVVEDRATLKENALLKARSVLAATALPAIADDTGLEVSALGGAPGVYTGRFAGPDSGYADNVAALLAALEGADDRSARFRAVIALCHPDGMEIVVEGHVDGEIATEPRGDRGFGYDPVFMVGGLTFAEMSAEQKNRLSHRARAIRALAETLERR